MSQLSSDLLLDVYACAAQPERWRQVLDGLCRDLGARSAVAQIFDRDGYKLRQRWCERDSFSTANAALHDAVLNNDDNPRTDLRIAAPPGRLSILHDRDTFAADSRRLDDLRGKLSALGLGQAVGVGFRLGEDRFFALLVHRAGHDPRPFGRVEECLLRGLAPHLEQMVRLRGGVQKISAERRMARDILDQFRSAVIVCDEGGRVDWLNAGADRLLQRSAHMEKRSGRVSFTAVSDQDRFAGLLRSVASELPGAPARRVRSFGSGGRDAVHMMAFPLRPHDRSAWTPGTEQSGIGLIVTEGSEPAFVSPAEIAELLNLSPAEAALTAALCDGYTLQEHADRRGIGVGTARIQLKHVLGKTGTHRQADLVGLVLRSVLGIAA